MRVLIIEDNEANAYLARFVLERSAHEVRLAGTGKQGLALAHDATFDVILLDLHLPDANGVDMIAGLARSKAPTPTPVVVLSATLDAAERERAIESGCTGFIAKPIDVASFVADVERFTQHHGSA